MKKKLTTISLSTLLTVSAVQAKEVEIKMDCLLSKDGVAQVIAELQVSTPLKETLLEQLEGVQSNDLGEFVPVTGTQATDTGWTPVTGAEARDTGWTPVTGAEARDTGWTPVTGAEASETGWTPVVKDEARIAEILAEAVENSPLSKLEELLLLKKSKSAKPTCLNIQSSDND